MPQHPWQAIVLDLGNVIFEWSSKPGEEVGTTLKSILKSDIYVQYETGQIEAEEDFSRIVGQQLGVDGIHISEIFRNARASLQVNTPLVEFIRELKFTTGIAVYAMSNIPRNDIDYLCREYRPVMDVFDKVFTSSYSQVRKPNPNFFRIVIEEGQLLPERTIFVDDKMENVDAANGLGWHGINFEGTEVLCNYLRGIFSFA